MSLSNDERGWVMAALSGVACVLGASVICVDIIIRQFPGKKNFKIQDSDSFLSVSLSLSFGVMLFSALYSMLPSARKSLQDGGFSSKHAAWTLIACFIGGVVGIQIVSRFIHHFMPSHVVDCEHSHDESTAKEDGKSDGHYHGHANGHTHTPSTPQRPSTRPRKSSLPGHMHREDNDRRPLSRKSSYFGHQSTKTSPETAETINASNHLMIPEDYSDARRPSLQQRLTTTITKVVSGKDESCSCDGPCYGFSEPCGQECFKNVNARGGFKASNRTYSSAGDRPSMVKSMTAQSSVPPSESTPLLNNIREESRPAAPVGRQPSQTIVDEESDPHATRGSSATLEGQYDGAAGLHKTHSNETTSSQNQDHHHHHVPTNAFMSIGLQTSIAIALHKLPEGFITYATNHANPRLGVSVFLALFIHNITEGFAMALPLYLAINNRFRAMLVSFVLGGLSQPIGAGVAALWFKIAGQGNWSPSEGVYGGMFAVTAGIMASVALQLFSESLDLTHSRTLCMAGAFTGMAVLGISSALTA
ncbi:hypothetical protein NU219Hw_g4012t1 [Hortaea werneckii]